VANGGQLLKPYLVKALVAPDGKVIKEFKPETVRQVISKNTSQVLMGLLGNVVSKGTGKNAFPDGYGAAGKTGTAQVVEAGGYADGKYVASFVGFTPADDPQLAVLVMVAEPTGASYFGSQVAAPAFKAIAEDTLHYLKVPERPGIEKPKKLFEVEEQKVKLPVPNVAFYPLENAQNTLKNAGFIVQVRGAGTMVGNQVPKGGAEVLSGTTVILELIEPGQGGEVVVPEMKGLTMKEAASVLDKIGLSLSPSGTGFATGQKVAPGTKVPKGTAIEVDFSPPAIQTLRD
jgi:stage V sporulation protein D (sporulation-specific penicillin-binding protein)